jgi:hypothetical protein
MVRFMLAGLAEVRQNRRQWHDLRLVGQIEDPKDVQPVQKLRGADEPVFDEFSYFL